MLLEAAELDGDDDPLLEPENRELALKVLAKTRLRKWRDGPPPSRFRGQAVTTVASGPFARRRTARRYDSRKIRFARAWPTTVP